MKDAETPSRASSGAPLIASLLVACVLGQTPARGADPRCGSRSLYVALKGLDFSVESVAALETQLGVPPESGYSMGELAEVAEQYGANVLGVETTLRNLNRRPGRFACIALLEEGHFVNLVQVDNGVASIIDAPKEYELPLHTFDALWTGKALLVSSDPLIPEEQVGTSLEARLQDAAAWLTVGKVVLFLVVVVALGVGAFLLRRYRTQRA